jgi:Na+-transporting NADH:ubiquinone oxidoreductase subunit NqrE
MLPLLTLHDIITAKCVRGVQNPWCRLQSIVGGFGFGAGLWLPLAGGVLAPVASQSRCSWSNQSMTTLSLIYSRRMSATGRFVPPTVVTRRVG